MLHLELIWGTPINFAFLMSAQECKNARCTQNQIEMGPVSLTLAPLKNRDLFNKITDTKGIFRVKMGSIKDGNCMDLTETEDIKKS